MLVDFLTCAVFFLIYTQFFCKGWIEELGYIILYKSHSCNLAVALWYWYNCKIILFPLRFCETLSYIGSFFKIEFPVWVDRLLIERRLHELLLCMIFMEILTEEESNMWELNLLVLEACLSWGCWPWWGPKVSCNGLFSWKSYWSFYV